MEVNYLLLECKSAEIRSCLNVLQFVYKIKNTSCFLHIDLLPLFTISIHWGTLLQSLSRSNISSYIQYTHLIPAPDDWRSASAWLYKHPRITCQKNKPSTSMPPSSLQIKAMFSCKVKVLWLHSCPGNWVAIEGVVMYYAQTAPVFSAGITCWHCT